jgi:hypothetical protein
VNDPTQCPNAKCRSESFDAYDTDGGPPDSELVVKCSCDGCGATWIDYYGLEFERREIQEEGEG